MDTSDTSFFLVLKNLWVATVKKKDLVTLTLAISPKHYISDNKAGSMCGTPNYIAPEVLRKEGHSPASEVWSLGCMIFALLCGAPPFETESVASTYSRIAAGNFSLSPSISASAASFLQSQEWNSEFGSIKVRKKDCWQGF